MPARTTAYWRRHRLSVAAKHLQRAPQRRCRCAVSVREPPGDAVQQQIDRARRSRLRRRGASGLGDLGEGGVSAEAPGEDRRAERFEVRLACKSVVEGFEALRRLEEQRRGVASPIAGEDDLGPQPRELGLQKVVERADLRRRDQRIGGVVVGGLELGLCCRESSCGPRARVNGQLRPPAPERPPRRRHHHGSWRARRSVPGQLRRPRRAPPPRAPDARRADRAPA